MWHGLRLSSKLWQLLKHITLLIPQLLQRHVALLSRGYQLGPSLFPPVDLHAGGSWFCTVTQALLSKQPVAMLEAVWLYFIGLVLYQSA